MERISPKCFLNQTSKEVEEQNGVTQGNSLSPRVNNGMVKVGSRYLKDLFERILTEQQYSLPILINILYNCDLKTILKFRTISNIFYHASNQRINDRLSPLAARFIFNLKYDKLNLFFAQPQSDQCKFIEKHNIKVNLEIDCHHLSPPTEILNLHSKTIEGLILKITRTEEFDSILKLNEELFKKIKKIDLQAIKLSPNTCDFIKSFLSSIFARNHCFGTLDFGDIVTNFDFSDCSPIKALECGWPTPSFLNVSNLIFQNISDKINLNLPLELMTSLRNLSINEIQSEAECILSHPCKLSSLSLGVIHKTAMFRISGSSFDSLEYLSVANLEYLNIMCKYIKTFCNLSDLSIGNISDKNNDFELPIRFPKLSTLTIGNIRNSNLNLLFSDSLQNLRCLHLGHICNTTTIGTTTIELPKTLKNLKSLAIDHIQAKLDFISLPECIESISISHVWQNATLNLSCHSKGLDSLFIGSIGKNVKLIFPPSFDNLKDLSLGVVPNNTQWRLLDKMALPKLQNFICGTIRSMSQINLFYKNAQLTELINFNFTEIQSYSQVTIEGSYSILETISFEKLGDRARLQLVGTFHKVKTIFFGDVGDRVFIDLTKGKFPDLEEISFIKKGKKCVLHHNLKVGFCRICENL